MNKEQKEWRTKLMDEFCVMFERSGDENNVEKLEIFIKSLLAEKEEEIYRTMNKEQKLCGNCHEDHKGRTYCNDEDGMTFAPKEQKEKCCENCEGGCGIAGLKRNCICHFTQKEKHNKLCACKECSYEPKNIFPHPTPPQEQKEKCCKKCNDGRTEICYNQLCSCHITPSQKKHWGVALHKILFNHFEASQARNVAEHDIYELVLTLLAEKEKEIYRTMNKEKIVFDTQRDSDAFFEAIKQIMK